MSAEHVKAGDIIGFSGYGWKSAGINVVTGGLPLWSISHIGIIGHSPSGQRLLFESTEPGLPCEMTGRVVRGVQAHNLQDVVDGYRGRVWKYSLYRPLYRHEHARLSNCLHSLVGRPYDDLGAVHSGGMLFSLLNSYLRGQDLWEMFCSELVAHAFAHSGLYPTTNASRWNPTHYVRSLRRAGIIRRPVRLYPDTIERRGKVVEYRKVRGPGRANPEGDCASRETH